MRDEGREAACGSNEKSLRMDSMRACIAFLMILFSLTETGGRDSLPLVTIPVG